MINILSCSSTLGNCCSNSGIVLFLDAMRKIMNLIQIIVPILLMIMAAINFTKMVMNQDINSSDCDYNCFVSSRNFKRGMDDAEYFVRDGSLVVFKPYIYMETKDQKLKYDFEINL